MHWVYPMLRLNTHNIQVCGYCKITESPHSFEIFPYLLKINVRKYKFWNFMFRRNKLWTYFDAPVATINGRVQLNLGWGLLSQFPPFRYFPKFSSLSKDTLAVKYRVYIWQVSPQLSCGDTCQIWMWFEESNMYFCEIENFAYGKINERSFSNPHPSTVCVTWISNHIPHVNWET